MKKAIEPKLWMVLLIVAAWAAAVLVAAIYLPAEFKFDRTGQFGDSFGIVSAVMSAIAAVYALKAYNHAKAQAERTAASQRTRDDELTFFRMLETRRQIITSFEFSGASGLAAIQAFAEDVRNETRLRYMGGNWSQWLPEIYRTKFEDNAIQHLWHYFRFTYHLVRFIDERFEDPDVAYGYVRMLRAELSDAEQQAIALNGLYFGKKPDDRQFQPLIEKYALLHNISDQARLQFGLDQPGAYSKAAFDYRGQISQLAPKPDIHPPLRTAMRTPAATKGRVFEIFFSSWK